ncbi:MAG: T9SS type A sorting domain-containing protein, partial [Bacteroidales bacterium]|nr:T9SS type A sorting domain-containing protein [Bacteroidales bacterium]
LNFTDDFTFSFFARSYTYNYPNEQFYAAYSTTGNSASDFMNLDDVTTTTTTWTEYSYTVPADAKYVAIHCVSTDVYMFCVDDISISGNVVSDVVVNLYDNGVLVASNVNGGTYTATGLSAGEHCFSIRAVCNDDSESLAAQSCVNVENITPPPTYTITINAGNGGSISPNGTQTVNEGGNFTFTVTPNDCYEIASVTVNGAPITLNANNSYTIQNVTADQTINATFNQISYAVTTLAGNGGSINNAPTSVNCGEGYTFTVTPNDCYEIASVTVNGTTVTPTNNIYTIANVTEAQSINATFNRLSYIITASASEGGTITPSGNVEVNCGDNKEFVIAANEGYEIENVVVDGQSQGAITNYTFENVTEAGHSIEATFNQIIVVPECNAVTNLVASVENYGIVLSWNAVENASSYDIYRNGERIATETNTSAIDLQGHEGDRYYIITNCANGGTSDASEMITATAEPTCNAITDLTAMVESYGIALAWEAAENAVSYDIYCNGNRISTATTTSYIDLQGHEGDTYYIITNCANGGTSDASESATAIVTSISEVENNIAIFPNPANDILNITSSETISEIEIVNTLGQVVYRVEVNSDNAVCDVNELASGVYVVKIHTLQRTEPVEASLSKGTAIVQKKFVKE